MENERKIHMVGKYPLNLKQYDYLVSLGLADEDYLDSLEPPEFRKFAHFGEAFVDTVRVIRGSLSEPVNLLDPECADPVRTEGALYERPEPSFHPLESGRVDVNLTLTLASNQARWLDGFLHRIREAYPEGDERRDLGHHLSSTILEVMKRDTKRHGSLAGGDGGGTISPEQLKLMQQGLA